MAKRSRRNRQSEGAEPLAQPEAPAAAGGPLAEPVVAEGYSVLAVRRVLLSVILIVFGLFMATIMMLFSSGGSIQWKKELTAIEARFARGEAAQAAAEMVQFGERWPGAKGTVPWHRKTANYFAAAGDWENAARYYESAVAVDDARVADPRTAGTGPTPGLRAEAGEAFFRLNRDERAAELLTAEIEKVRRSVGKHDEARFYLGLIAERAGRYDEAVRHFQGIADSDRYDAEKRRLYEKLETEILEPARLRAAELPTSHFLQGS
jgi:tetratricopeptide (TPR) repeat protein